MSDEFQLGNTGNWWDGTRNRYEDSGSTAPASTALNSISSFGWQTEMVDIKARSSMDAVSVSGSSMGVFPDSQRQLQPHESSSSSGAAAGLLVDPSLHMMGLGLSSQSMDWNQALYRGEKAAETSFRSMLQEDHGSTNFQQQDAASHQDHWRHKLFGSNSDQDSSVTDFKQFNRGGLSLDQPHEYSSHSSSTNSTNTNFQVDSAPYGGSPNVLQGLLVSSDHNNQASQQSAFDNRSINYSYPSSYAINTADQLMPSNSNWSKFPQFLRSSPPKQQPPHGQLHFSNNTPFWNASTAAISDARSSFFPSLQTPLPTSSFEEKPKQTTSEVRELAKKTSTEASNKRTRNETTPSPMPAFKVRKEKMGDRITALQQLVSPFGKTDTASVLSEAIEYIKFLHEQVSVLSTPYMKSGAHIQHPQQVPDHKSKDPDQGPKQDLRSRGLCLVPVPSNFPVINESNFDFWNPTFGGTYR